MDFLWDLAANNGQNKLNENFLVNKMKIRTDGRKKAEFLQLQEWQNDTDKAWP